MVGTLALVVATSGAAYAAHALPKNSVGPAQVRKGAIHSAEIKDGKVKTKDLAPGAVGGAQIAPGAVGGAQIADGSVSLADLVGVDTTVIVTLVVNGDSCQTLDLAVPGAEVGQAVLLVPSGGTVSAVFAPPRVTAPGVVTTRVCAVGIGTVLSQTPFRVVTLN